jgi:hypothetical protein
LYISINTFSLHCRSFHVFLAALDTFSLTVALQLTPLPTPRLKESLPSSARKSSDYTVSRSFGKRNNIEYFRKGIFFLRVACTALGFLSPKIGKMNLLRKEFFTLETGHIGY